MQLTDNVTQARTRLVEMGGRTSQDLGLGRIVGQVLVHLYLQHAACSLDVLEDDLGLSKASVSVAARQLEQMGLVRRVWKKGDRKSYYRSADNIAAVLQQGVQNFLGQKVQSFGIELEDALSLLEPHDALPHEKEHQDARFLRQRLTRAQKLQRRLARILNSPVLHFFTGKAYGDKRDE